MGVWIGFNKFLELIKITLEKINSTAFWNVSPCSLVGLYGRFRVTYFLYLQGLNYNRASNLPFVKDVSVWKGIQLALFSHNYTSPTESFRRKLLRGPKM
jgi:hypothetical protein